MPKIDVTNDACEVYFDIFKLSFPVEVSKGDDITIKAHNISEFSPVIVKAVDMSNILRREFKDVVIPWLDASHYLRLHSPDVVITQEIIRSKPIVYMNKHDIIDSYDINPVFNATLEESDGIILIRAGMISFGLEPDILHVDATHSKVSEELKNVLSAIHLVMAGMDRESWVDRETYDAVYMAFHNYYFK